MDIKRIVVGKQYRFQPRDLAPTLYQTCRDHLLTVTQVTRQESGPVPGSYLILTRNAAGATMYVWSDELVEIEKPIKRHVSLDVESDFVELIEKVMSNGSPLRGAKIEINQVLHDEETGEINGVYGTAYPLGGVDPEPFTLGEPLR
jgi:hypothetical protein